MEKTRDYLMIPLDSDAYRWVHHAMTVLRDMYLGRSRDTSETQTFRDHAAYLHKEMDNAYRELWKLPVCTFTDAEVDGTPALAYANDPRKDVW